MQTGRPARARHREVILAAFADDEGFRILGEEILRQCLVIPRYTQRHIEPTTGEPGHRIGLYLLAGVRSRLQPDDLGRLETILYSRLFDAVRRFRVDIDDRTRARVEVYRSGLAHGWYYQVPVIRRAHAHP